MDGSILEMLKKYKEKNAVSFCMPGHKNGRGLGDNFSSFSLDVTELFDTDNLYNSNGTIDCAKKKLSEFFGAKDSFFLVNGSTGGIFTMLASALKAGDRVLVSRNCHISVINACSMLGYIPIFINQEILPEFNLTAGIDLKKIEELIIKYAPKALLITSPNYFGICCDIENIAKISHKYNIPLLVDEAHGAHFSVSDKLFPQSAVRLGADLVVQSAHKTLNAVNQTAFLHYNSKIIPYDRVKKVYSSFQTSSPSYVLCSSAEEAVTELVCDGFGKWSKVLEYTNDLKNKLKDLFLVLDYDYVGKSNIFDLDKTRIVINFKEYDVTGFEISQKLRKEYNIDIEMADLYNIVLIPTPANKKSDFDLLYKALLEISGVLKKRTIKKEIKSIPKAIFKMSPREAIYENSYLLDLKNSVSKISAGIVMCYPPGVPILAPGVEITCELVDYILNLADMGAEISGLFDDNKILVVE